jgi:L-malate glycosyltransferase
MTLALNHGTLRRGSGSAPHLLHVFASFGVGGVPARIATIINHFGRAYRHTIIALDGNQACASRLAGHADVTFRRVAVDKRNPLRAMWRFRAVLEEIRPDLLLTYNWGAVEWGLVNRWRPVCRHVHLESGFGVEEADGQIRRRVLLRRVAVARAECLVVPSHTLVEIARRQWRIPEARIRHIPNGVDTSKYAASPKPGVIPGFVKRHDEAIVGTLAPLRPEKNIARLLYAFAGIQPRVNARLLIVGDGGERAGLTQLAADLGLGERVVFAGHVEAPEQVLGWFDVFALSSDTEQMPNAVIQAMAAGRAVAAVDVGDVKHILSPENRRFVVAKADPALLGEAIRQLVVDPAGRAAIGRQNQAHVRRHYDQQAMFAAYAAVFDRALAGLAGAAPARPLGDA